MSGLPSGGQQAEAAAAAGACSETYGEDPFLTAELSRAFVRGLQVGERLAAGPMCSHVLDILSTHIILAGTAWQRSKRLAGSCRQPEGALIAFGRQQLAHTRTTPAGQP